MGNAEGDLLMSHAFRDPLNKVFNILLLSVKYSIHEEDPVGAGTDDSYIFT